MSDVVSTLVCSGCGHQPAPGDPRPFRCSSAGDGDDVDHVLRRRLDVEPSARARLEARFIGSEPRPFVRFRELFHSYRAALDNGLTDDDWVGLAGALDREIATVAGSGFRETPFDAQPKLADELGCTEVRVKDETGNVGGTHKGRHLAGLLLWLRTQERLGRGDGRPRFAISSCGNAAWAATLLARATGRPIDVYVPPDAGAEVLARLESRGAGLRVCERRGDESGDPCYLRFLEALAAGALPFTCQGPANGLVIEGGQTLVWEMIATLLREEEWLDRLFVQTGGGALATACVLGWREARQVVDVGPLPALHPVQTEGAAPLVRAWDRFVARVARAELGTEDGRPGTLEERAELAARIHHEVDPEVVQHELRYAATHRSEFMWPWEEEPHSVADAILDDETYDWLPVLSGMLESGGFPVVVSETRLFQANELGARVTGIAASETGTAGLAGALELAAAGLLPRGDRVGLLFTG